MSNLVGFVLITLMCALLFILIGFYSLTKKSPVHFFTNQRIQKDQISDVKSYNKEVGLMWLLYGCAIGLCALLHVLIRSFIGPLLLVGVLLGGIGMMAIRYSKIYNKYSQT